MSRRRTRLLLENKKQNMFASENNLKFMRIPQIYEGFLNPQGERGLKSTRKCGDKKFEFYRLNNC